MPSIGQRPDQSSGFTTSSGFTLPWGDLLWDLTQLGQVTVPRCLRISFDTSVEIHGFADASQPTMDAVVHVRVTGRVRAVPPTSRWCVPKTKSRRSNGNIPGLELAAASLLARLTRYVQDTLGFDSASISVDGLHGYTNMGIEPSISMEGFHSETGFIDSRATASRAMEIYTGTGQSC